MRELSELAGRVADLERRVSGTIRHGKVHEVNTAEKWVRLDFGKSTGGDKFLSPKVPYAQIAGALKLHTPPSKGQQMSLMAPGGDWQQAVALPMTWSDQNKSPSDKDDEHVLTFCGWEIKLTEDNLTISKGGTTFDFSADGYVQNGGKMEHDGHLVDKTHVHTKVVPGAALSGPPPG